MNRGIRTDSEGNIYVGKHLKNFRKLINITQIKMSMDLGVSQKQISFWENEEQPMPRYYMKQLIKIYGSKSINLVSDYQSAEIKYYNLVL